MNFLTFKFSSSEWLLTSQRLHMALQTAFIAVMLTILCAAELSIHGIIFRPIHDLA